MLLARLMRRNDCANQVSRGEVYSPTDPIIIRQTKAPIQRHCGHSECNNDPLIAMNAECCHRLTAIEGSILFGDQLGYRINLTRGLSRVELA